MAVLGHGPIGKLAIGQSATVSTSNAILAAGAGVSNVTGVSVTFAASEIAASGAFGVAGAVASFTEAAASAAGTYALGGVSVRLAAGEWAGAGAYAINGPPATFRVVFGAARGASVVSGQSAVTADTLVAPAGAYALSGNAIVEPQTMVAAAGAAQWVLAPLTPFTLTRSGGDAEQVYGGIGHYREEQERLRRLARITRTTPAPVVRATRPRFAPLHTHVASPVPAIDPMAVAPQRPMDRPSDVARAARQAAEVKRRREEAEVLLLTG